jgi:hypothetical protein
MSRERWILLQDLVFNKFFGNGYALSVQTHLWRVHLTVVIVRRPQKDRAVLAPGELGIFSEGDLKNGGVASLRDG